MTKTETKTETKQNAAAPVEPADFCILLKLTGAAVHLEEARGMAYLLGREKRIRRAARMHSALDCRVGRIEVTADGETDLHPLWALEISNAEEKHGHIADGDGNIIDGAVENLRSGWVFAAV